jgi:integrase
MAQLAVAIHLLSVAPVRMQNLSRIRIGENLLRPGGPEAPYMLVFAEYDVKNRQALEFPLPPETSAMLDTYIHIHRPVLMRGHNHDYLFPGKQKPCKDQKTLGNQISDLLFKHLGVKLTPHQFRHAAGAIILQAHPGNYELVRRVLGHKSIQTTIRSYIGLETLAATQQYGKLVLSMTPDRQSALSRRPGK